MTCTKRERVYTDGWRAAAAAFDAGPVPSSPYPAGSPFDAAFRAGRDDHDRVASFRRTVRAASRK